MKTHQNPSQHIKPVTEAYLPRLRKYGLTAALAGGRIRITPTEKLTPEIAVELAEHADEIRAELLEEASTTATAAGNPAIAPGPAKTAAQIDEPRDLPPADVSEHPWPQCLRRRPAERWTDETHELIAWFRTTTPPSEPFDTPGGLTVSDPQRYWAFIADRIADGAGSPHPGLTAHLRQLRTIWEERHG